MGGWSDAIWESSLDAGLPRRDRRSGSYRTFIPDLLVGAPLTLDADTARLLAEAERRVRALAGSHRDLAGISRFLLRSEAIASSRIEGISPSARQVALAELGQEESVQGISEQAQMVANNMTLVREATTRLVDVDEVTVAHIEELHRSLLKDEPCHHGLPDKQNWIGGSDWHPLEAEFVPPAPGEVRPLMDDLVGYLAGAAHSPIAQAALVHAQFETIHPFTDGNGRVGRALIHTVLARRGLATDAVLPISLVLSTLSDRYVAGLTTFRVDAPPASDAGAKAHGAWIEVFTQATILACEQAAQIAAELAAVRSEWDARLAAHREAKGVVRAVRTDSAIAVILADLPATPVLTAETVKRIHHVSHVAAGRALEELREAGILSTRSIGPGRRVHVANDVLRDP